MIQQNSCEKCDHTDQCRQVYQRLGKAQGASIASRVVVAFLVPMVVFIAALAVFERIFAGIIETKQLQTIVSLLLALPVTAAVVLLVKLMEKRFGKTNYEN